MPSIPIAFYEPMEIIFLKRNTDAVLGILSPLSGFRIVFFAKYQKCFTSNRRGEAIISD